MGKSRLIIFVLFGVLTFWGAWYVFYESDSAIHKNDTVKRTTKGVSAAEKQIPGRSPKPYLAKENRDKIDASSEHLPLKKEIGSSGVFEEAWRKSAKLDPVATLKIALDNRLLMTQNDPSDLILLESGQDAPKLIEFIRTMDPESPEGHYLSFKVAKWLASKDYYAAIDSIKDLPVGLRRSRWDQSFYRAAIRGVLNTKDSRDPVDDILQKTYEKVNDHEFGDVAKYEIGQWYANNIISPEKVNSALELLFNVYGGNQDTLLPGLTGLSAKFPERVAEWVYNNNSLNLQENGLLVEEAFGMWAVKDIHAVSMYLKEHKDTPLGDAAIAGLVQALNHRDPDAAEHWRAVIKDDYWKKRADAMTRAGGF